MMNESQQRRVIFRRLGGKGGEAPRTGKGILRAPSNIHCLKVRNRLISYATGMGWE